MFHRGEKSTGPAGSTAHGVPHMVCCVALGVNEDWFADLPTRCAYPDMPCIQIRIETSPVPGLPCKRRTTIGKTTTDIHLTQRASGKSIVLESESVFFLPW